MMGLREREPGPVLKLEKDQVRKKDPGRTLSAIDRRRCVCAYGWGRYKRASEDK